MKPTGILLAMETYKSFEEKDKYFKFGGKKIDTVEDYNYFTSLLMLQYSKNDFIFRGVSDAKYKLYNSAQRKWFEISNSVTFKNDCEYDKFIIKLMNETKNWNNKTITNLLKTYDIKENNSIAYLGFMRHFEIPTPLIDYSKNPNIAFYFATESISDDFKESKNEIDNYFSIYSTYQNNTAYEIFRTVFDKNRTDEDFGEFDYENLTKNAIALFSDKDNEFRILNNIRIANQEGLFFYNNSPNLPIEEQYKTFSNMLLQKIGEEKFKEILVHDTFSSCFNFNKKFSKNIKKLLMGMGITKEFMYPEISKLQDHIDKICT